MARQRIFSISLFCVAGFLLFWWPLSHWLYYSFYNDLLGFVFSATNDGLVKMIGSCGFLPVFALAALAFRPKKNGPLVAALSLFSLLLSLTFLFLVIRGDFPTGELINVALCGGLSIVLPFFYHWAQK